MFNSNTLIKCRAAILRKECNPMTIEDVLIEAPEDGQVRLRMVSAGICASDSHFLWGIKTINCPAIIGHEGAGIVESVGSNVTKVVSGDHVLTTFMYQCKKCDLCNQLDTNLCRNVNQVQYSKLADGTPLTKLFGLGVFSEYIVVPQSQIVKIPKKARLDHACIISCSISTGFYSATNLAKVKRNSTCAVWGLGGIGLNVLFGCKYNGARNIIGIDINEDKQAIAEEFGCTSFINPNKLDNPVEEYLKETYGGGVDYAFECVGNQTVIETALKSIDLNGTFVLVGGLPSGAMITYSAKDLIESNHKIIGGLLGNMKPDLAFNEIAEMYIKGEYNVDRLISNKFTLNQINDAFDILKERKCVRSLIQF